MNTKAAAERALVTGAAATTLAIQARVQELMVQQRAVLSRAQDVVTTDRSLTEKQRNRRIAVMKLVAGADNFDVRALRALRACVRVCVCLCGMWAGVGYKVRARVPGGG